MDTKQMSKKEIDVLQTKRNEILLNFLPFFIVTIILVAGLFIYFYYKVFNQEDQYGLIIYLVPWLILFIIFILLIVSLMKKISPLNKDIKSKKIVVKESHIENKTETERLAHSFDTLSEEGFEFSPENSLIKEYQIVTDNYVYQVDKETYDNFNIYDKVELHFSEKSHILLSINKLS